MPKNSEIIRKAVLEHKIFGEDTEKRVEMYERMKIPIPLHTSAQWEKEGYQVKDDQNPAVIIKLWKVTEDEEKGKQFQLVPAKLYTVQQCVQTDHREE